MSTLDSDPSSRLSRRHLFKTAGAASAAASLAVGAPWSANAQEASPIAGVLASSSLPESWDREVDVVVAGSGAAAFAAAVTAKQGGADVLILERGTFVGGTTLISGNAYWIPNNSQMRAAGLEDPREDAIKYMARCSWPALYDPEHPTLGLPQLNYDLIATFFDTGSVAIDQFEAWGALYSIYNDVTPDYQADLEENKAPYGRGMRPDAERGTEGTIPQQMHAWTEANGVETLLEHRVVGVYQNAGGDVVGVRVETADGELNVRAWKAIVFGTGGFTADPIKSLNYLRGPVFGGCGVPTCTGDFVDIGISLGAALGNMNNAWWLQAPLEIALANSGNVTGTDVWLPFGDSMIIVNKYGDRLTSEKMVYNERSQTHHVWSPDKREYPNLVQFMIWDEAVAQNPEAWSFRYPVPMPGDELPSYVIKGDDWVDLTAKINERLDSLRGQTSISGRIGPGVRLADTFVDRLSATIERFNGFAESGVDEDFARGSTPIQVVWHGPPREEGMPNPTMAAFSDQGPYYCIILGGATLDTKGGPSTDTSARVLKPNGEIIPGLYAAGNCSNSAAGQAYWAAGGTLGGALAFGYIAGMGAAAEAEKSID
jgi:succinate dehydrogenase/fumarate reductase flavoprotein subunit